jgi:polyphosphate kinase
VPQAASTPRFFNRELSWLAFNKRVLEEAEDSANPVLERAKFLAIVTSNLDEFCSVRLGEIRSMQGETERDAAGLLPEEQLSRVWDGIRAHMAEAYACWADLFKGLAAAGITIVCAKDWTDADRATLHSYYRSHVEPILTPLAVDPARPFPLLANRRINIGVLVHKTGEDASSEPHKAIVEVPDTTRLIALTGEPGRFALLEDVVEANLESLFAGYTVNSHSQFRITRDSSLELDEDKSTDILLDLEEELYRRGYGNPVRIEMAKDAPPQFCSWLIESLGIDPGIVIDIDGPIDFTFLFELPNRVSRQELRYPPYSPPMPKPEWDNPFVLIREQDVFIHHPYESFDPVVRLVQTAARDKHVLAIKQTLYRVSGGSSVVAALEEAAKAGKQVTALVEIKARFEEEANIRWARRLEESGAHVAHGLLGLKVHAKLLLIIREEEDGIKRYCHIGTGNYNDRTAAVYSDFSFFTANEAVCRDVAALFNMLTGFAAPPQWEKLAVAPHNLRETFVKWIRREAENARAGFGSRIMAKLNSLVDVGIAEELYAASQAGVEIDLVIRGVCILRPGVPGLSERIRVRSIVGRYLEHGRLWYFENKGNPIIAVGSADWMTRNLDRRVEAVVPIEDTAIRKRLLSLFNMLIEDNAQARVLKPDGAYVRLRPRKDEPRRAAQEMHAAEALEVAHAGSPEQLRPAFTPKPGNGVTVKPGRKPSSRPRKKTK